MGNLYVVSAPSGAGKTTVCQKLLAGRSDLVYSISHTTRPPRSGEKDGLDYFFVPESEFRSMIEAGAFLEWAEVFGRLYGTGRAWVEARLAEGLNVLADVDVAGARQIKANFPEAVLIFILPPSLQELGRRLTSRQTESETQLKIRLERSREEIRAAREYDFLVVNDDLNQAVRDLDSVVRAEELRTGRQGTFLRQILERDST